MCMFTDRGFPLKHDAPIRCLKLVYKVKEYNSIGELIGTRYISPFSNFEYKIGEVAKIKENEIFAAEWLVNRDFLSEEHAMYEYVCKHGLHTFEMSERSFDAVMKVLDWMRNYLRNIYTQKQEICLLECEIPANVPYYEGKSNCMSENHNEYGYCSEQLNVLREIDYNEYVSKCHK